MNFRSKQVRVSLVIASVALYGASLALPAFTVNGETDPGFIVLLMGWMDVIGLGVAPLAFPAWLANLFIPVTWVLCLVGVRRLGLIMATIGLSLSVVILLDPVIAISEAGGPSRIAWGAGYPAWVSSFAVALLCASLIPTKTPAPIRSRTALRRAA